MSYDKFEITHLNRTNDVEGNKELTKILNKLKLYIQAIVISDSNKLRQVYQKYVDQNEDNTIKFEWSHNEHKAAVILETHLFRINIYSFDGKLIEKIYGQLSNIVKKIDHTKRSLNGLNQLIPKYYESKIQKMLSSNLEKNKYKLIDDQENNNLGY